MRGMVVTQIYSCLAALLVLGCTLKANHAAAAACCTSATAFGTGRLLLWESHAVGLRAGATHELGFFDHQGIYEANDTNYVDQRLTLEAYTLIGITQQSSIFLVVPWMFPRIGLGEGISTGSNLSDILIGYRHQLIDIGEYEEVPSLALTASVLIPTGTPKQLNTMPHQVTGKDSLAFLFGATLEKTWFPFFVQLNIGTSYQINHLRSNRVRTSSFSFQSSLSSGVEITPEIVLSAQVQGRFETSGEFKQSVGASLSWRFDPHFTLLAQMTSDLLFSGLAANLPGSIGYGFGIRYGYF